MYYEGPIAVCFKRGHSSTIKNAATAFLNAALDTLYGRMFKTRPQVRSLCRVKKNATLSGFRPRFFKRSLKKCGLRPVCFVVICLTFLIN